MIAVVDSSAVIRLFVPDGALPDGFEQPSSAMVYLYCPQPTCCNAWVKHSADPPVYCPSRKPGWNPA
jgi:hypothetical protein